MSAELKRPRAEIRARMEKLGLRWEEVLIESEKAKPQRIGILIRRGVTDLFLIIHQTTLLSFSAQWYILSMI